MAKISVAPGQVEVERIDAKAAVKADTGLLGMLRDKTPQEAEDWIQANVNSLAEAKQVLGKMAKILVYLAKKELS